MGISGDAISFPLFSKAIALFSGRAEQSLFCLVIVTIGKMVQNG